MGSWSEDGVEYFPSPLEILAEAEDLDHAAQIWAEQVQNGPRTAQRRRRRVKRPGSLAAPRLGRLRAQHLSGTILS